MWQAVVAIVGLAAAIAALTFREWFPTLENALNSELAMAPRTSIGRIRAGVVAASGRARAAGVSLIAPISGRRCLAFQITIYEIGRVGSEVVARFRQARPFWIEDDTGRALVDPGEHFELALRPDAGVDVDTRAEVSSPFDDAVRRFARARAFSLTSFGSPRHLRFREGTIGDGEAVAVAGHAVIEPHPQAEAAGPRRVPICSILRGGGWSEPLLLSDDPRANGR